MGNNLADYTEATTIDLATAAFWLAAGFTPNPSPAGTDKWARPSTILLALTGDKNVTAYASVAAALTALGTSTKARLLIPVTTAFTVDTTIPDNITVVVTGSGEINVSATKTLTINGPLDAPLRQVFTGSGTVKFGNRITDSYDVWFGAAGNGSTDDTAAIQKAISAFQTSNKPHAGGTVWIVGGSIISSTLTIEKTSILLKSTGWGPSNEAPYSGFLKWNGSAGSPMILIQDCWNSGVENIRLIGKSSAKPTAAIEFKRQLAATTQLNHSYARDIWIGSFFGYDSDDAIQFDAGLLFSGTIDGDTNSFERVVVNKCTIGIDIQNGNASDTHFDTLKITSCGTGVKNDAFVTGTNWIFGNNDLDINVLADKHLVLTHFTTEGAKQFVDMGINAQIAIKEGGFQVTAAIASSGAGSGVVIDATNTGGGIIILEDCRFVQEGGYAGPIWKIKARNTGGAYKGYLRLVNCSGISSDNLDVATTGGGLTDLREVFLNRAPSGAYDWGTNSHVYLTDSAAMEENRFDFASKVNIFGGPLRITQIAAPTNVTATPTGGTGTTYSYKIVAKSGTGKSLPSTAATCSGGATLSGSVYNLVEWYPVLGADAYEVYGRTGGSELLLATISASKIFATASSLVTSFKDDGSLTPSGALPTVNSTAGAVFGGPVQLATYTTTQRDALPSPANGMLIYNSTTTKIEAYAGGAWVALH